MGEGAAAREPPAAAPVALQERVIMPTLTLKLAPPPSQETQERLAAALTRLTAQALGKRADLTAVIVEPVALMQWHLGGVPARRPTALLEVSITEGTCSAVQKAAFIEGAQALLRSALAEGDEFEDVSYVVVREWPAADWGYGGRTQASRQQAVA
jgi:4-oxalocrotonate tautomerase